MQAKRVRAPRSRQRPGLRARARTALRGVSGNRFGTASVLLVMVLTVAGLKLVYLQAFQADALSARAERQRATVIDIPAHRGSITDRNGTELAFSVKTRMLQVNLKAMRETWDKVAEQPGAKQNYGTRVAAIAEYMAAMLPGKTTEQDLLRRFHKPAPFTFLVDNVDPSVAEQITTRFPEIYAEERALREYPGGTLASNVVGYANWRMEDPNVAKHNLHGLIGLESARDNDLAGKPGRRLVDTGEGDNVVIPGTERDIQPAVAGSNLELTLDSDLQYDLQRRLSQYVEQTRAEGGSAVIMDARTGEVYALANDKTFDPNDLDAASEAQLNNRAVTTPYEPGSVNKVVTAAAAIEHGVTTPKAVHRVPGQIQIADRTVRDAWAHGMQGFTTTGIFAKSSNVGTLMLAQQVGEDRWLEIAEKLGLGKRTG
ncbi:MAG: peptidoglycan D,D-transpeptidase FtsI family protein, partial [Thermocrispum sp.]